MAGLSRRARENSYIWPGFVDALSTLLIVIIFLLLIFVVAQFFLGVALSGKDRALRDLEAQVVELGDLLALERDTNKDLSANLDRLSGQLQASVSRRDELEGAVRLLSDEREELARRNSGLEAELGAALVQIETDRQTLDDQKTRLADLSGAIERLEALKAELEQKILAEAARTEETQTKLLAEKELSESARAEVALLNQQMAALRDQIEQLSSILSDSETKNREQGAQLEVMGKRLNAALATKVQELSRYRSEFFGRLRDVLGGRAGVRIVGDRFVFQSEVLFDSGSADLGDIGKEQLAKLARTLNAIAGSIPPDIDWILRVDGHTDNVPIATYRFPSNWELSSARSIAVVKFLIGEGLPANRLTAAGFGEYQPLDESNGEEARARNRRIEFKLDQR
ncbi:MAG: peptidoglycan -binding protein [Rhodospirillales bacterium]